MLPPAGGSDAPADGAAPPVGGVLLVVRDLFFRVKLEAALRDLAAPQRRSGPDGPLASAAAVRPDVVVLDLGDGSSEPLETVRALRGDPRTAAIPIVGFAPHADTALRAAAREAGCTLVVARSRMAAAPREVLAPFLRKAVPET